MPDPNRCSPVHEAHANAFPVLPAKRGLRGTAATCTSDASDSGEDSGEDSGLDSGDAEDSASGPYRFWATEAPYAETRGDARLVLRRPGGHPARNVADGSTALQLRSEAPAAVGREHQSRILFVALLENYCRTYDDDPLRNRRLFFAICRTLHSMGIIGKEYVDELSSVRATYSDAFRQLVVRAQASLGMYEQHDIESGIRSLMSGGAAAGDSVGSEGSHSYEWSDSVSGAVPASNWRRADTYSDSTGHDDDANSSDSNSSSGTGASRAIPTFPNGNGRSSSMPKGSSYGHGASWAASTSATAYSYGDGRWQLGRSGSPAATFESVMMDAQRSRYHDDFVQLRCLGRGGFGKVYEVRNKLDGRPYAVKLIKIKGEITAEKTLREIKTLANLDHPNIVRYYSSWLEVTRMRKRSPSCRRDPRSASPLTRPPRGPMVRVPGQRRLEWAGSDGDEYTAELSTEWQTVDSAASPGMLASSPESLSGIQFQLDDMSAGAPGSSGSGSTSSASRWAAVGDSMLFGRRMDSGEAAVIAEVSIGHTNESCEQRREVEDNIVFELSADAAAAEEEEEEESAGMPVLSGAAATTPEAIPIDEVGAGRRHQGHRRQHSLHVDSRASNVAGAGMGQGARSMSVLETQSGEPRSLPTQVLAGLELGPAAVAETTLFVQMQLCQTTLQEFLLQRNERIARGKQHQGPEWCGVSDYELLIDPVMNVRLFRAIVEGVKYFHNRGVIHRDLKGANVFLDVVYADSGGDPISRAGSGIGRPGSSSGTLDPIRARMAAQSPPGSSAGLGNVHSDAWDAIDGGNLKGRLPADTGLGVSAGASVGGRRVDWDTVFASIVANRSISTGPAAASAAAPAPAEGPPAPGDAGPGEDEQPPPPMVAFIPRIGDFGLATRATLAAPAADEEYAPVDGDGSAGCSPASHSSSSRSRSRNSGAGQPRPASSRKRWAGGAVCDVRRTSNVGTITYAAPEQLRDQAAGYNEKADIYSLGIIFFELYHPFATAMERAAVIKDLRQGVFPEQFVQAWPKEAAFILQLMGADPARRPSAKEILSLDLIDVPTLESAQLRREVLILKQQLRAATLRNEELGLRVRELERIVDMTL